MAAKLSNLVGIRLTEQDTARLTKVCRQENSEPVEFMRGAALAELARREAAEDLAQVARLREAGIDLKGLVDYAIGRQLADKAQLGMPFIGRAGL